MFSFSEILTMQNILQEKYKDIWEPINRETAKNKLLWMVGEIGEVADIIKKNGHDNAADDPALRAHLVEELADVLMYYGDVLNCMGITEDELKDAFVQKFEKNMTRWKA